MKNIGKLTKRIGNASLYLTDCIKIQKTKDFSWLKRKQVVYYKQLKDAYINGGDP